MSTKASNDTLDAMKDADRHARGDNSSHAKDSAPEIHGHEHTKPAGDQRAVADKEDSNSAFRGEFNRGH